MSISNLIQKWSGIDETSKLFIITDANQRNIAEAIKAEKIYNVQIEYFPAENFLGGNFQKEDCAKENDTRKNEFFDALKSLKSSDLLIVLLSIDTYMKSGINRYFTAFGKPDWVAAKYIFVRLDISKKSLLEGLSTEKELVYRKIEEMDHLDSGKLVTVTNESGTNISFRICSFTTCSHEITADGGMAFLPPSETSSEVISDTANGKIVVDITVGQLYHFGKLIGNFGLVQKPVTITVQNGFITDIEGGEMAAEFKRKLFDLPVECRRMVELGQGLSKMEPTGLIGVDESIIDSCHFGFGDGQECGTHLDVVIKEPVIKQIS